jgi:hypothetical protein
MRARRLLLALAGAVLLACGEPEKYEVPAGIRPEDAVFFYKDPLDGGQQLIVHLSRADQCHLSTVPSGTEYVELGVHFPSGISPAPGTYDVIYDARERDADLSYAGVSYMRVEGACGFIAITAESGSVTLESVSDDEIRGTFAGVDDTVDLHGSFVAKPCVTTPSCG